jgi:hypothetical protein
MDQRGLSGTAKGREKAEGQFRRSDIFELSCLISVPGDLRKQGNLSTDIPFATLFPQGLFHPIP